MTFDIQFITHSSNQQWLKYIDTSLASEKSFWLRYKATLGSARWLLPRLTAVSVAEGVLLTAVFYFVPFLYWFLLFIAVIMPRVVVFCWCLVSLRGLSAFNDALRVKDGLKRELGTALCGVALFAVCQNRLLIRHSWIRFYTLNVGICLVWIGVWYWSMLWVVQPAGAGLFPFPVKPEPEMELELELGDLEEAASVTPEDEMVVKMPSLASAASDVNSQTLQLKLAKYNLPVVLSRFETLSLFMQHCIREFSTENLLCICECMAFKHKFLPRNPTGDAHKDGDGGVGVMVDLDFGHEQMPRSTLVHETHGDDIDAVITALCLKYVVRMPDFEINVSSPTRKKYRELLADGGAKLRAMPRLEKVQIFDPVLRELKGLIRDSFSRFLKTPWYQQCVEFLSKEPAAP